MNDLEKYYLNNDKRVMSKYSHYFELYEQYFSKFRNKDVTILEIGVEHGGSLQMWKDYFGKKAKIYGIDRSEKYKQVEEEQIKVIIGDQGDRKFLESIRKTLPKIDILIDDGSHESSDQIVTFEELFLHLNDHGVYFCEDTHTSYKPKYCEGCEYGSFIEYMKSYIDYIHGECVLPPLKIDIIKSIKGLYFYVVAVVVEKGPYLRLPSSANQTGTIWTK